MHVEDMLRTKLDTARPGYSHNTHFSNGRLVWLVKTDKNIEKKYTKHNSRPLKKQNIFDHPLGRRSNSVLWQIWLDEQISSSYNVPHLLYLTAPHCCPLPIPIMTIHTSQLQCPVSTLFVLPPGALLPLCCTTEKKENLNCIFLYLIKTYLMQTCCILVCNFWIGVWDISFISSQMAIMALYHRNSASVSIQVYFQNFTHDPTFMNVASTRTKVIYMYLKGAQLKILAKNSLFLKSMFGHNDIMFQDHIKWTKWNITKLVSWTGLTLMFTNFFQHLYYHSYRGK